MKKREGKHKKTSAVVAGVAAIALLLTGTFAWSDYSQHKTNEANAQGSLFKARLVEIFDPNDTLDWKVTDPAVNKQISVLNPAKETDDDKAPYGDVYVRLQFKEFLEFYDTEHVYTEDRYMIDTDGNFISFEDEADAIAFAAALDEQYGNGPHVHKQIRMYDTPVVIDEDDPMADPDANLRWYIQTKESDPNGVYGAFILLDTEVDWDNPRNILEANAPDRASDDQKKEADGGEHDEHSNGECNYTAHTWANGVHDCVPNGTGKESFHDYVQWVLGADVITIDEWDGNSTAKWILDTTSTQGWIYWGEALAPGKQTSNVLEQMLLLQQPNDTFYYALHTDMQAVSFSELDLWTDAPADVIASYQKIDSMVITPALVNMKLGATKQFSVTINSATLSTDVTWSLSPTDNGSSIDEDGVVTISETETSPLLTVTATSVADPSKSVTATITIASELSESMQGLTGTRADIGARFEADGYKWRVLEVDDNGNMLIFMAEKVDALNIAVFKSSGNSNAYFGSDLETQMHNFYRELGNSGTILYPLIQPAEIGTETVQQINSAPQNANVENAISKVSSNGRKTCFALSASEANKYMPAPADRRFDFVNDAANDGSYWLRSPYSTANTYATYVYTNGTYIANLPTGKNFLRPAMWININDLLY